MGQRETKLADNRRALPLSPDMHDASLVLADNATPELPNETWEEIALGLTPRDLARFSRVNSTFKQLGDRVLRMMIHLHFRSPLTRDKPYRFVEAVLKAYPRLDAPHLYALCSMVARVGCEIVAFYADHTSLVHRSVDWKVKYALANGGSYQFNLMPHIAGRPSIARVLSRTDMPAPADLGLEERRAPTSGAGIVVPRLTTGGVHLPFARSNAANVGVEFQALPFLDTSRGQEFFDVYRAMIRDDRTYSERPAAFRISFDVDNQEHARLIQYDLDEVLRVLDEVYIRETATEEDIGSFYWPNTTNGVVTQMFRAQRIDHLVWLLFGGAQIVGAYPGVSRDVQVRGHDRLPQPEGEQVYEFSNLGDPGVRRLSVEEIDTFLSTASPGPPYLKAPCEYCGRTMDADFTHCSASCKTLAQC